MHGEDGDVEDVARVLAGDLEAFAGIVQRWQGRLVNLAWRFSRDRFLAEDMAQEAFVKAFRSLSSFRKEAAFSTWLTAIALNTYRSRMRGRTPWPAAVDVGRLPGHAEGPFHALERGERVAAVRRAVLALPARYRDAIVLFYFEEKDLVESARLLGVAEGTFKAWLHRGRELLRRRAELLLGRGAEGKKA